MSKSLFATKQIRLDELFGRPHKSASSARALLRVSRTRNQMTREDRARPPAACCCTPPACTHSDADVRRYARAAADEDRQFRPKGKKEKLERSWRAI
jgi:hypothetical protein